VTTTGDSESDVAVGELVGADGEDGLVDLVSENGAVGKGFRIAFEGKRGEDSRFNGRQGLTVETDQSLAGLDESHGGSSLE
jgi:hypothetical protein